MKTLLFLLTLFLPLAAGAASKLVQQWEADGLRVPESVLYHAPEDVLFVSEIEGESNKADGQGGIAKLSPTGKIIDRNWVRGLDAPKGMGVHDGKLYVADLHKVAVIDLETAEIESQIPIADAVFLNDIAIDDTGAVYVSDTRTGKIHRIRNGEPEVYLEDVQAANGLTYTGGKLYIGAGDTLWKVGEDKALTEVAKGFAERADGVEMIDGGEFIVSCWAGLVYHVSEQGELTQLLDTRERDINTADIGWHPERETVYIPTFHTDSVVAYKLQ